MKENVIVGRLIPAGNGGMLRRMRKIAARRDELYRTRDEQVGSGALAGPDEVGGWAAPAAWSTPWNSVYEFRARPIDESNEGSASKSKLFEYFNGFDLKRELRSASIAWSRTTDRRGIALLETSILIGAVLGRQQVLFQVLIREAAAVGSGNRNIQAVSRPAAKTGNPRGGLFTHSYWAV